jgi:hypothetical protein
MKIDGRALTVRGPATVIGPRLHSAAHPRGSLARVSAIVSNLLQGVEVFPQEAFGSGANPCPGESGGEGLRPRRRSRRFIGGVGCGQAQPEACPRSGALRAGPGAPFNAMRLRMDA